MFRPMHRKLLLIVTICNFVHESILFGLTLFHNTTNSMLNICFTAKYQLFHRILSGKYLHEIYMVCFMKCTGSFPNLYIIILEKGLLKASASQIKLNYVFLLFIPDIFFFFMTRRYDRDEQRSCSYMLFSQTIL